VSDRLGRQSLCLDGFGVSGGPREPLDELPRVVVIEEVRGDDALTERHLTRRVRLVGLHDDLGHLTRPFGSV
jgi:hypothetical protein